MGIRSRRGRDRRSRTIAAPTPAHVYPLPVPYVVYNGKFLKADRDGVRGTLFNQDWVELNLSFNATTPVRNDRERSGMPDLQPTVEIGPSLDLHLLRSDDARGQTRFAHAAARRIRRWRPRRASSAGRSRRGSIWISRIPWDSPAGISGLLTGPLFADRRYHDYFYSVAPQYATPSRPPTRRPAATPARSSSGALSKRFPKFWVGAYVRYDTLAGAAFVDSPLVQRKSYWSAGFGISWMIQQSSQHGRSSRLRRAPCCVPSKSSTSISRSIVR